jgi:hypothetical protein
MRGTTTRAKITMPTTTSAALPIARAMFIAASPGGPAEPSSGTISTIGTTQRSWKISVPTMKRPCGASSSRRSESARSTMAVLESAKAKP